MRKRIAALAAVTVALPLAFAYAQVEKASPAQKTESRVPARAEGATLRVVSFNILFASKKEYPWAERRAPLLAALRDMNPDIFGVQEAEWVQLEDMLDALPEYTCVGRGRDDGSRAGETMGLFFRRDRFILADAETFWLSDTPQAPGSNTWGAACRRTATVAILLDRTDGTSFGVCNTHFDHKSAPAREKSAELLMSRLPTYVPGLPWIVTGDFNSNPSSKPHRTLVGSEPLNLIDTFAAIHLDAPKDTSSYHGFASVFRAGSRIDWVLVTPDFQPLAAEINVHKYEGVYPSDHSPVWADLKRK